MHSLAGKIVDPVIRVSSLGGRIVSADSTMTIDQQESSMVRSILAMGGKVGKVHHAVDESGFTFAASEDMNKVVGRIEDGRAHGLAFAYLDRNGRNWWAQGAFFTRLQEADAAYVIPGYEGIDYRTPVGRQVFGMASVSSEGAYFAARERSTRIQDGVMARKVPNRVPYGYRRNGTFIDGRLAGKVDDTRDAKALVIDGETGPVVARIFDMAGTRHSTKTIAAALNAEGIPSPTGRQWTHSTVGSIIANPIYKGEIVFGRLSGKKKNRKRVDPAKWLRTSDAAIVIVTADVWKNAQSKRTVRRTGAYKAGVAGGLLLCSGCGRTLSVIGTGDGRFNYGCRRHSSAGTCPKPTNVKKDAADAYVDMIVADHLSGGVFDTAGATRRYEDAKAKLASATADRDGLMDKVKPSHPKFADFLADLDAAVEVAQAELDDAADYAGALGTLPAADEYLALPVPARNRVAGTLLAGVQVNPPVTRSKTADIAARFEPVWH